MAYGCTLTVDTGQVPSAQGDFVWLFTQQNFVDANNEDAINGSVNSILNGGGNLRCYTDNTKTTQLPIEVVTFVTGVSPQVQVWGLSPSISVGGTIYVEADDTEITQPPVTDVYGRNAVWKDFEAVIHASEIGTDGVFVDSTGNNHGTTLTTGSTLSTLSTGHPFGGTWPDFTGLEVITLTSTYQTINNTPFTLSCLVNIDVLSNVDGLFGNRYSTGDIDWAQIQSNGRVFSRATGFAENRAEGVFPASTTGVVKLKQNASSLQSVFNSTVTAEDTTISGGESINNVNSANSFRVGGYFNNSESFRYNGRAAEFRIKKEFDDADRDEAEENNILNSGAFWSTSAWEEQGGGGVTLSVDSGNYSYTGAQASLKAELNITTSTGSYLLTGSQSNLISARKLLAEVGNYNLSGTDVTLIYTPGGGGETLIIDSGVYSLSGTEAILKADLSLVLESGNYQQSGNDLSILFNGNVTANTGNYELLGASLNTLANYGMIVESVSYSLTGRSVTLRYSGDTAQVIGSVTAGFAPDAYSVEYKPNEITVTFKA